MPAEPQTRVIVTIDDAHLENMDAIVSELQTQGMQVSNVLRSSGIITGQVLPEGLAKIRQVNGILDVEQDGTMDAI